jgi:glyoxylase-like metal-dependent hydrolase (beta-lactamase superfamily II)
VIDLRPVADGVFVARTQPLDVNVTVALGSDTALVVDTLATDAHAHALRDAIRTLTSLPLTVVITHFHFDHCLGTAVLADGGRPVWGHPYTASELAGRGRHWQLRWHDEWASAQPELAAGLAAAVIQPPDRLVRDSTTLDLGGRTVTIQHPGRAHTAGDLIAYIPDVDVLIAGDLIEEGNPPDFSDSYPLEWPAAVARLLDLASAKTVIVPGHGAIVDREFVHAQHAQLAAIDWLIRYGHLDRATVDAVASRGPFPIGTNRVAATRGFAALDGHERV